MVDTAYQGPEGRSEGLRPVIPPITAYTERVRLSLAVGDAAEPPVGETVASNLDAATAARALIGREITECMIVIFLDARRRITGYAEVARGTVNATRCTPRDVLIPALFANATAIVIAHNHPSNDPSPSSADKRVTAALRTAAEVIAMTLVDHVIVSATRSYSFAAVEGWS